jgi:tetratricopeptide (TPR) repeat protein
VEEQPVAMDFDAAPAIDPSLSVEQPPPKHAPEPEPEIELEQEYELVLAPEPLVPAHEQKPPEPVQDKPPAPAALSSDQFLADLASEIDQLGMGELAPSFSATPPPPAPPALHEKHAAPPVAPQPPAPSENAPLKEVFEEFRAELGEMGAEDEDLETHYNLGIAFREMGLLEEAISEFQKVAKANDHGKPFRYAMQCCTLLGLAFMEKGQPGIAAIWYDRALHTPGLDAESTLALRYDLGVAQESAGELEAALKSFSQVYAVNIDYRDVAERITALQKTTR